MFHAFLKIKVLIVSRINILNFIQFKISKSHFFDSLVYEIRVQCKMYRYIIVYYFRTLFIHLIAKFAAGGSLFMTSRDSQINRQRLRQCFVEIFQTEFRIHVSRSESNNFREVKGMDNKNMKLPLDRGATLVLWSWAPDSRVSALHIY